MRENLQQARLYFLLLVLCTLGRWGMGFGGVKYEEGHQYFSIVILTVLSSLYYPAFLRRSRGDGVIQGLAIGVLFGLASQSLIFISTLLSYLFGLETYFNHPRALNVTEPIGLFPAMVTRSLGLFVNSLLGALVGMLGWALGALLPAPRTPPD